MSINHSADQPRNHPSGAGRYGFRTQSPDELGQMTPDSAIPAAPTGSYDWDTRVTTGSLYIAGLTSDEVAALTREQLAAAVATGELTDEFEYTVESRESGNTGLQRVGVVITVPVNLQDELAIPLNDGTDDAVLSDLAAYTKATVRKIADARNQLRKQYNGQTDSLYALDVAFVIGPERAPNPRNLPQPATLEIPEADVAWWVKLAEDYRTPPALLAFLASSENETIVAAVAGNDETPADVLASLAAHESSVVLEALSYNPRTPPETLTMLFHIDKYGSLSAGADGLAGNPSTPQATLRALYEADVSVYDIARNPNIPLDLLETILLTGDEFSRRCALDNTHLTPVQLERASYDADSSVRKAVLRTRGVTQETVERLAADDDASVRELVAGSYTTVRAVLVRLCSDHVAAVSTAAKETLDRADRMERNRY